MSYILTDEQCDEFRRLPMGFNDMVRAIYSDGQKHAQEDKDIFAAYFLLEYLSLSARKQVWIIDSARKRIARHKMDLEGMP